MHKSTKHMHPPPSLPNVSPIGIIHGRLLKRSSTFHTWKQRSVYLQHGRMQFFNDKGIIKGDICLQDMTPVVVKLFEGPSRYGFIISFREEKIFLCAEQEEERQLWVDAIVAQCGATLEKDFVVLTTDKIRRQDAAPLTEAGPRGQQLMDYGSLREPYSRITFPPTLSNGDLLCGIGPIVRRVGWTDERILSVALYIESAAAEKYLDEFKSWTLDKLCGDQRFYDRFIHSPFRKTFVISTRGRTSRSVIIAILLDELAPRVGRFNPALEEVKGFIDKSLKKGESMVMSCNQDGTFDFRYKNTWYPPIASMELCNAIQGVFFDLHSIQHEAKHGLIERIPSLYTKKMNPLERIKSPKRNYESIEEDEEEYCERSTSVLSVQVGPIIDLDSNVIFEGKLPNGHVLLGSWTKQTGSVEHASFSVGLYVDVAGMNESLLRYKGLSVGSLLSDPRFYVTFETGPFSRSLMICFFCETDSNKFAIELCGYMKNSGATIEEISKLRDIMRAENSVFSTNDRLCFSFDASGTMTLSRQGSAVKESAISSLSFSAAFQDMFYGYNAIDPNSRPRLFQRIPSFLDGVADDLAHTYRDEIEMLKENYQRQAPGTKLKVGYIFVLETKRNGNKKWSKRWCCLDGRKLSYYSHKRKKKPRGVLNLQNSNVNDISSKDVVPVDKANEQGMTIRLSERGSSAEIVFRTENAYDGADWLDALIEASGPLVLTHTTAAAEDKRNDSEVLREANASDGSLLSWIASDVRNKMIMTLLTAVVWLTCHSESTGFGNWE